MAVILRYFAEFGSFGGIGVDLTGILGEGERMARHTIKVLLWRQKNTFSYIVMQVIWCLKFCNMIKYGGKFPRSNFFWEGGNLFPRPPVMYAHDWGSITCTSQWLKTDPHDLRQRCSSNDLVYGRDYCERVHALERDTPTRKRIFDLFNIARPSQR